MRIVPLGGADEVGASCTFVELGGRRVIVDCGIRMGGARVQDPLPNLTLLHDLGGVDAILVTHAHLDHCGALPLLHQAFPHVPVYATAATLALIQVMLGDALKVMANRYEQEQEIPLYSAAAVVSLATRFVPLRFCEATSMLSGDVAVTAFPAGHVLGAAMLGLEGRDGRLLMTGDYSVAPQRTVEGLMAPRFKPDILVTESTYGDRLHANRQHEEHRLAEAVAQVVEGGGKALIPAFALGRAQEVILILEQAQRDGLVSRFPVWVDGMVKNICSVYTSHAESLARPVRRRLQREGSIFFNESRGASTVASHQREAISSGPPCAIVASSGMLTGGPSLYYAQRLAGDEKSRILITGYQDEESPGRRLLELADAAPDERVLTVEGRSTRVTCQVGRYGLSAHADSGEMTGLISRLAPDQVVLVHGSGEAREGLAHLVEQERSAVRPANGDELVFDRARRATVHPVSAPRPGLGKGRPIDLAALHHYLVEAGLKGPFSATDLAQRWYGTPVAQSAVEVTRQALEAPSGVFEPDGKRPYLWVPKAPTPVPSGPLEQNQAIAAVDRILAGCTDLYRRGAHPDRRALRLSFYFPRAAQSRLADRLAELAEVTGWAVEVDPESHPAMLQAAVAEVLPAEWRIDKTPSYHREEGRVEARVHMTPGNEATRRAVIERYRERTGLELVLKPPVSTTLSTRASAPGKPWEINRAYAELDRAFADLGAKLLRRGQKTEAGGQPYLELSFISPQVGARYVEHIESLSARIGWALHINPEPNQNAMKDLARQLVPAAWGLAKEPGFFKEQQSVKVRLRTPPDAGSLEAVAMAFKAATGYRLVAEPA